MTSLTNRSALRTYALQRAAETRPAWAPSQVSKEFLDRMEARLRAIVAAEIQQHPTKGKTLR